MIFYVPYQTQKVGMRERVRDWLLTEYVPYICVLFPTLGVEVWECSQIYKRFYVCLAWTDQGLMQHDVLQELLALAKSKWRNLEIEEQVPAGCTKLYPI